MRIGRVAKAMVSKVVTGKMDTSKPAGGKVEFGYAPKGRKGKKA